MMKSLRYQKSIGWIAKALRYIGFTKLVRSIQKSLKRFLYLSKIKKNLFLYK